MLDGSMNNQIIQSLTIEEATRAIDLLMKAAQLEGIEVHEVAFAGGICGYICLRTGKPGLILIKESLSIQEKAWVLAHEIGHYCTVGQFTAEELNNDLLFGDNYELIARVEQAADEWAAAFLNPPWRNKEVNQFVAFVA